MGETELREALAAHTEQGNKLWVPLIQGLLAELEAEGQDAEGASSRIDAALALAVETGERWTDALLHRIRGDILRKLHPDDTSARGGGLPRRHRRRSRARRAQLRPAGRAGAGEALPIHRPPRRSPRHPRARARKLCTEAGVARNRGGAGAARSAGGHGCRDRSNVAARPANGWPDLLITVTRPPIPNYGRGGRDYHAPGPTFRATPLDRSSGQGAAAPLRFAPGQCKGIAWGDSVRSAWRRFTMTFAEGPIRPGWGLRKRQRRQEARRERNGGSST